MTLSEALKQLETFGSEKMRAYNAKSSAFGPGAGDNQYGVALGDIRKVAKKIKMDHALALSLWDTGNVDAQFLATLVIDTKKLSAKALDKMVRTISFVRVSDWLNSYVVSKHPDKEPLRERPVVAKGWMASHRPTRSPKSGRTRSPIASRSHRIGNAQREARSPVDDEQHVSEHRHPHPETAQASHRDW